ncbi:hypothetical protein FEM48_Zijuj09G0194100 [Ziziphus jujuba var. spinosa]|uniref:Uncharacterized protein n=1 Tax=Ziziphus jujuba var. spinosa TaxID=714518 RepID=A0A978UUV6_ZIZJJ|nr:hypothetical protein FEM48_Zijuj09G0194100 [Ziziphus jujuba var. spinosa]
MVVELLFSTRFGFFAHCLPSRLCVFGFDDSHETPTMAEQTEKAFLKQPKVFLRGHILAGTCHSAKMEGDHVIIGQCRPLSKTMRFNVLKVIPAGSSAGGKKAFTVI